MRPCRFGVGLRLAPDDDARPAIPYNYRLDAGAGSQTITVFSESKGWRAALLGTVAAGSLWLYSPRTAKAACTDDGPTILNCADTIAGTVPPGVVDGGIFVPDTYTTLNVYGLDADIAPDTDVDGIYFHRTGADNNVVINSDTTPFDIVVNGAGADGIDAASDAAITINHFGVVDASLGRNGIRAAVSAAGTGPLNITTNGEVLGGFYGIAAHNDGVGALEIVAKGNVVGTTYAGIYARHINVAGSDSLSIKSYGSVAGGTAGIRAINHGSGATEIIAHGDVMAATDVGIYARNLSISPGLLSITSHGTVTGNNAGIRASSPSGTISIVANSDVTGDQGIVTAAGAGATVTVNSGATVSGGTIGVLFLPGANNTLNNRGTVSNLAGVSGPAILGSDGSDIVNNFGVVTGSVLLAGGANAFNNMDGGLFNSGAVVALGGGNVFINEGTLSPGGAFSPAGFVTVVDGNFVQSGSTLEVNLLDNDADRVAVSGSATLAGEVKPLFTLSGLGTATQWSILFAPTPIVDNGISAVSTAAVTFDLIFPGPAVMDLVLLGVNFAPVGLNKNETAIGNNLTKIYDNGSGGLVSLLDALAALPEVGDLADALDQLSPEIYLDTEIATLFSAQNFASSLMTCPVRDGPAAFIKEGECVWARLSGRDLDQAATSQTFGFDERSFEVAGGMQGALGEVWRVGFAGAYEHSKLDTTTNASSDADRIHGGAVLKYNPGALLLAGAVSGGWGWYETDRPIAFPGFLALAQSDQDVGYINGRLRAAYQVGAGVWYAKPMVDLDATHVSLDGVSETGAGGAGLKVHGANETVLSATPALELGTEFTISPGALVRPYVRGGATFFDDPDFTLLASFEGAPGGVGPFRIATSTDDVVGTVGAGVDVISAEGSSLRIYYSGSFGDTVTQHDGGLKATWTF